MNTIYCSLSASLTALALISLPACASFDNLTTHPSPLPLEAIGASQERATSTRAFEAGDRLYVTGHMQSPAGIHISTSAHVDVQLIGEDSRILAEEQIDIDPAHPRTRRARTGRHVFVASFPLEQARQASKVRVSYHRKTHGS